MYCHGKNTYQFVPPPPEHDLLHPFFMGFNVVTLTYLL
jgi:hypothetical protein